MQTANEYEPLQPGLENALWSESSAACAARSLRKRRSGSVRGAIIFVVARVEVVYGRIVHRKMDVERARNDGR